MEEGPAHPPLIIHLHLHDDHPDHGVEATRKRDSGRAARMVLNAGTEEFSGPRFWRLRFRTRPWGCPGDLETSWKRSSVPRSGGGTRPEAVGLGGWRLCRADRRRGWSEVIGVASIAKLPGMTCYIIEKQPCCSAGELELSASRQRPLLSLRLVPCSVQGCQI